MTPEEAIEELNHELLILKCLIEEVNSFICDCDVDDDEYDDEKEQFEISLTRYKKEKEVIEMAISAIKELQQYHEIGTVEECRKAAENKKKCEKQWHNDMENPLEPIKVYSALKSEISKLELRIKNRPKDISILDYTVIAALQKVLKNNLEAMEDERD